MDRHGKLQMRHGTIEAVCAYMGRGIVRRLYLTDCCLGIHNTALHDDVRALSAKLPSDRSLSQMLNNHTHNHGRSPISLDSAYL